jgi:hypothetical protein
LGRAFNGHLAGIHHQFLSARMFDSIDADIARHPRADRGGPLHVEDDPGHQGPHAEDLDAAPTPLVLAQVEC